MTIPRSAWIALATVLALGLVAGTVWWLRTRSLRQLTVLDDVSETVKDAPSRPSSASTTAQEAIKASDEIVNRPVFFTPPAEVAPGINIVYPSDGTRSATTSEPGRDPNTPLPATAPPPADPGESDPDGDGLTNNQEQQLGTDITKKDTDGDGLMDGDEVKKYRTDPLRSDSDSDKYSDAEEIKNGYNPLGSGKCLTSDCAF